MAERSVAPSTPAAKAAAARLAGIKQPTRLVPEEDLSVDAAKEVRGKRLKKKASAEKGADGAKKKKPVKPILAVVLVLLVGFVVKGKVIKPHYAPGQTVPPGEVVSLGTITTNLSDGHLAQVSVSLQLTAPANEKLVAKDEAEMVASAVTDVGEESYAALLAPSGRTALRSRLLSTFEQQLGTSEGAEQVSAVYFTRFVLQ